MGIPKFLRYFETLPYNPRFHIAIVTPGEPEGDTPSDDQIHPSTEEVAKDLKDQSTTRTQHEFVCAMIAIRPPPPKKVLYQIEQNTQDFHTLCKPLGIETAEKNRLKKVSSPRGGG